MTRKELGLAQFFEHIVDRCVHHEMSSNPDADTLAAIVGLQREAARAFFNLVGVPVGRVHSWELNTLTPAPWTKEPWGARYEARDEHFKGLLEKPEPQS